MIDPLYHHEEDTFDGSFAEKCVHYGLTALGFGLAFIILLFIALAVIL